MDPTPVEARRERISARVGGSLRSHTASGMFFNALVAVILQGLAFLRGFLVAIFMAPEDYGVWAIIVIAYLGVGRLFKAGVADKYIQQDDPDEELAFQKAFTLEAILTGGVGVLLAIATPLLALAYRTPEMIAPGLVSLLAIPGSILQIPIWAYARELEFKRARLLSSVDPIVGVIATVVGAVAGLGYWSFVLGSVCASWGGALVVLRYSPYKLRFRFDRVTARDYVGFSWPIVLSSLSNSILIQGVTLVARGAVGLAGIGAMSLANSVRTYTEFADGIISSTMYPAICAVKDRREMLFESFVKSNRLALMWGVPVGIGAALFAGDLLHYVLGDQWTYATFLFQAVGIVSAIGHVAFNWDSYVRAIGDTRPIAKYAWITLIAWALAPIPLMIVDGLRGYGIGLMVVGVLSVALRGYFLRRLFAGFALTPHVIRALAPAIPPVLVILAVRAIEPFERTGLVALAELALYLAVTVAVTWMAERELLREAIGYLRSRTVVPAVAES
jgi:O-antigen/teichoic acid export membrane protein